MHVHLTFFWYEDRRVSLQWKPFSPTFDGLLFRCSVDKRILLFYSFVKTPGHTSMQARDDHLQFSTKFRLGRYVYTQKSIELCLAYLVFFFLSNVWLIWLQMCMNCKLSGHQDMPLTNHYMYRVFLGDYNYFFFFFVFIFNFLFVFTITTITLLLSTAECCFYYYLYAFFSLKFEKRLFHWTKLKSIIFEKRKIFITNKV